MIIAMTWFYESLWGAVSLGISSLLDWLPIIIIPLLLFWGVKSFFDYIIAKSRFSLIVDKQVKSLDNSFLWSSVDKNNRVMKYWYNPGPMYDERLKTQASLRNLKDKYDLTDFSTFSNFYEQKWPHVKYGIDEYVWKDWWAPFYYAKNDSDFFSDNYLTAMREETRKQYWNSLDVADIPRAEKSKKYAAFCELQDRYAYKKFLW